MSGSSVSIQGGELVSLAVLTGIHSETTVRNKSFQVSQYSSMFSEKAMSKGTCSSELRSSANFPFFKSYTLRRTGFTRWNFTLIEKSIIKWSDGNSLTPGLCVETPSITSGQLHRTRSSCFQRYGLDRQRTELGSCLPLSHRNYHQLHFLQYWQEKMHESVQSKAGMLKSPTTNTQLDSDLLLKDVFSRSKSTLFEWKNRMHRWPNFIFKDAQMTKFYS